ncbi:MAG: 3-isopropylmalate dehydratase [Chloroflexi bacterium]|nr:3-isopropylmalate dehydratase [Chloroflexota bacterium]
MPKAMRGKAWVFGDTLDVDWEICPFETLIQIVHRVGFDGLTYEELGKYCMTKVDPDFPRKVQRGDFIVAGENMGYGHDHDHACMSIKGAGVAAVLCESTNANFLRNSIEHGLPVVELPGIKEVVRQGDELEVDLTNGYVRNLRTKAELKFAPYPSFLLDMLDAGGLYPHLAHQIKAGKPS